MKSRAATDTPLVSVIIPTYNYANFILDAITSAKSQDYPNIEIIVIDDGSTDTTPDLLRSRGDIKYIRQENNGLPAARNRGIDEASGKYLLFLDADDKIGHTSIHKRVAWLEINTALSFVVCKSAYFKVHTWPEHLAFLHRRWPLPDKGAVDLALCFFNIAPPHAFLVRKNTVDRLGLRFDGDLKACEDYDFWLRLAIESSPPEPVRTCWVYYRRHAKSMSRRAKNQARYDAELCRRVLRAFDDYKLWTGTRDPSEYLHAMLAGSLVTSRRLWCTDPAAFQDFLVTHVMTIQQKLCVKYVSSNPDTATLVYMALSRSNIMKMLARDRSISGQVYMDVRRAIPSNASYLYLSMAGSRQKYHCWRSLLRLFIFDCHYAILSLLLRSRIKKASQLRHRNTE
jgi:glycosyltransferase involved in cell wall biosynthesis